MNPLQVSLIYLGTVFLLSACGSGSGGSISVGSPVDPGDIPQTTFVSWSSITPPGAVIMAGMTQNASYTANDVVPPAFSYNDLGVATKSIVTIEYGVDDSIERINIETPEVTFLWDKDQGDLIADNRKRAVLMDSVGTFYGAFLQPLYPGVGWEYQTLGVWETGRVAASKFVGGVSMGIPTTGSAIPDSGDVTFVGETMGMYITADGTDYLTYSDLTVGVDFADMAAGLDLASSNTKSIPVDNLPAAIVGDPAESLDFAGTLFYDAGGNTFTGDISGVGLIGTSTGQFYGPNAEELGGVFLLSGGDGAHYSGAYGAAR